MTEPADPASWPGRPDATQVPTGTAGRRERPVLARAVAVALAAAVLGGGAGLLWRAVAPHVMVVKVEQGFLYAEAQPEQPVAADTWFAFLGVAAGLLAATVAWLGLRRTRGAAVLAGLVLGSLVGAWLSWRLGERLEAAHFEALVASTPVGGRLEAPLSLGITDLDGLELWPPRAPFGVLAAQALAAALAYTTLAGFATDPDLRVDPPEPEEFPEPAVRPTYEPVREDEPPRPGLSSDLGEPSGPPDSPGRP